MIVSATTLRYRFVEGPVPLEPYRVLATGRCLWCDWAVTLSVLGASHAVCLRKDAVALTELLACGPNCDAAGVRLEAGAGEAWSGSVFAHGIACSVALEPFDLRDGDALRGIYTPDRSLCVAYPALDTVPTPVTRLAWRIDDRQLTIETVHTYPEERRGVRSFTTFLPSEEP